MTPARIRERKFQAAFKLQQDLPEAGGPLAVHGAEASVLAGAYTTQHDASRHAEVEQQRGGPVPHDQPQVLALAPRVLHAAAQQQLLQGGRRDPVNHLCGNTLACVGPLQGDKDEREKVCSPLGLNVSG